MSSPTAAQSAAATGERIDVITVHLPQVHGRAPERALTGWVEGAREIGYDVRVTSWSSYQPKEPLPDWCEHVTLPSESSRARHLAALRHPRGDVGRLGWEPREGAWAVADDVVSVAAVAGKPRSVMVAHYSTLLDQLAVRQLEARHLQDLRHERRAAALVSAPCAYSMRVARRFGHDVQTVPIALPPPTLLTSAPGFVEEPVAVLPADWTWAPNRTALTKLLRDWPQVRAQVPGARLLLAGGGLERTDVRPSSGFPAGVEALGFLPDLEELWSQAAVLAFPCPSSSGPKVKVLEAAMAGVPVVTSRFGAEGLSLEGVTFGTGEQFAGALAQLLAHPERRFVAAKRIRESAFRYHSPIAAARKRMAVWEAASP